MPGTRIPPLSSIRDAFNSHLSLEAIRGTEEAHAVVVMEADEQAVTAYDPLHNERRISRPSFITALAARRNLVILVER